MSKGLKKKSHWTSRVHEIVIVRNPEGQLGFELKGGAENGQFPYLGEVKPGKVAYEGGSKLVPEELLLEVNETPVAGLTIRDVLAVIKHCKDPIRLKCVKQGKAAAPPAPSSGEGGGGGSGGEFIFFGRGSFGRGEQLCCCCSLTFPFPTAGRGRWRGCERRSAVPAAGRIKCASVTALRHAAQGPGVAAPPAAPAAARGRGHGSRAGFCPPHGVQGLTAERRGSQGASRGGYGTVRPVPGGSDRLSVAQPRWKRSWGAGSWGKVGGRGRRKLSGRELSRLSDFLLIYSRSAWIGPSVSRKVHGEETPQMLFTCLFLASSN